ncbi:MAG: TIM-barrel domain-containing protein [bacterium]
MLKDNLDENLFPREARTFDLFDQEEVHVHSLLRYDLTEEGLDLTFREGVLRVAARSDRVIRLVATSRGPLETEPSYLLAEESPGSVFGRAGGGGVPAPGLTVAPRDGGVAVDAGELRLVLPGESGFGSPDTGVAAHGGEIGGPAFEILHPGSGGRVTGAPGGVFRWSHRGVALDFGVAATTPVYALGEKTGYLNRRGRTYRMWNSDEPTHFPTRDPLYQSIPFFFMPAGEGWVGVFIDTPGSSWFDMGEASPERVTAAVEDRTLNAYVILGSSPAEVVRSYVTLTGFAPLPPLWSLGYHQSRHTYTPAGRVREIAAAFRERRLPADVIHFDILYMDGFRVFTWDPISFREPAELIDELADSGFRVVTIVDPGVKVDPDYEVYRSGRRIDAFCRTETGEVYTGRVWPGDAVFPDFSREEVRAWWAANHGALFGVGVSGIWNDMNEPADFSGDFLIRPEFTPPSKVMMDGDGRPRSMDAYHNVYGLLMCRAARHASEEARPGRRPFVLTRAGCAGIQRYAAVWTGDNHSWWEHLAASIPMLLGLGLSGVGFVGADVGGFQESPSPELYARWLQYAVFTPFLRTHTSSVTADQEPWSYGPEVEGIARSYLELRYRLLPYLYQLFREHTDEGTPIMRPLLWHYPDDPAVANLNDEFLLGESILVAPITRPGRFARAVYLPEGRWQDFWTGARHDGPCHVLADAPLDRIPLFIRIPAIIPMIPVIQTTRDYGLQPLELWLYGVGEPGEARLAFYEDDGDSTRYHDGELNVYDIAWRQGRAGADPEGDAPSELVVAPRIFGYTPRRPGWRVVLPAPAAKSGDTSLPIAEGVLDFEPPRGEEVRLLTLSADGFSPPA